MINLHNKTHVFTKNTKVVDKKRKGVKSQKIKVFPLVWGKYLSSWTGPGMFDFLLLVQFHMFRVQNKVFDENS